MGRNLQIWQVRGTDRMFIEIDPEKEESLKIAEKLLNDSEEGKKTIKEVKEKQKKEIVTEVLYE